MRVRLGLAVGLGTALVLALMGAKIFGSAYGVAGSNRVTPAVFAVDLPTGGLLCQPTPPVPNDADRAVITFGTYGRPFPATSLRLLASTGAVSARGQIRAGAPEGPTSIRLERSRGMPPASKLCLTFAGRTRVAVAGASVTPGPGAAQVNGQPQAGVISVIYYRPRAESWWNLLPMLIQRFGRGKAAYFADWTLPACILALLAVWVLTIGLLWRELT